MQGKSKIVDNYEIRENEGVIVDGSNPDIYNSLGICCKKSCPERNVHYQEDQC